MQKELVFALVSKKTGKIHTPSKFARKALELFSAKTGVELAFLPVYHSSGISEEEKSPALAVLFRASDKECLGHMFRKALDAVAKTLLESKRTAFVEYHPVSEEDFKDWMEGYLHQSVACYDWHNFASEKDGYMTTGMRVWLRGILKGAPTEKFLSVSDLHEVVKTFENGFHPSSKFVLPETIFSPETIGGSVWECNVSLPA